MGRCHDFEFRRRVFQHFRALKKAGIDVSSNAGVVIRDTRGRLSFVLEDKLSLEAAEKVATEIDNDLRPYISPIGPIGDKSAPGARRDSSSIEKHSYSRSIWDLLTRT